MATRPSVRQGAPPPARSHNSPRPRPARLFPASIMAVSAGAAARAVSIRRHPRSAELAWPRPVRAGAGKAGGSSAGAGWARRSRGSGCSRDRPRPARWRRRSRRGRGAGIRARRGAGRGVRLRKPFCGPPAERPGAGGGPWPGQPRLPPVWSLRSKTKVRRRTRCGSCGSANSASTSASGRAGIGSPAPPRCWSSSRGRHPCSPKVSGCPGALDVLSGVFRPFPWVPFPGKGSLCRESCWRIAELQYSGIRARLCVLVLSPNSGCCFAGIPQDGMWGCLGSL